MPFLPPNQQRQSTEGTTYHIKASVSVCPMGSLLGALCIDYKVV